MQILFHCLLVQIIGKNKFTLHGNALNRINRKEKFHSQMNRNGKYRT
uniref:Uncharacterized protein n=1 Tax=Anguilla anguilla TaxID=7936 RepID=A0A0E9R8P8_ANGAN